MASWAASESVIYLTSIVEVMTVHSVGSDRFSPLDRYRYRSGSVLDRIEVSNIGSVLEGDTNRWNRNPTTIRTDRSLNRDFCMSEPNRSGKFSHFPNRTDCQPSQNPNVT